MLRVLAQSKIKTRKSNIVLLIFAVVLNFAQFAEAIPSPLLSILVYRIASRASGKVCASLDTEKVKIFLSNIDLRRAKPIDCPILRRNWSSIPGSTPAREMLRQR